MTTPRYTRAQLEQERAMGCVRRPGLVADLGIVAAQPLFTVSGVVDVHFLFGVITTVIAGGLAVPRLQFVPTVGAVMVPLSGIMASIAGQAAGIIITWDGLLAGVPAVSAQLGMSSTNEGVWAGGHLTLAAGQIVLSNTVDSLGGVIDWYAVYLPKIAGGTIVAA